MFYDTNFTQHTRAFEEFRVNVLVPAIARSGLTQAKWQQLLDDRDLRRLHDEKLLYPFVGLVREAAPSKH